MVSSQAVATKVIPSNDQVNVAQDYKNKAQDSLVSDSVPERVVPELEIVKNRTANAALVTSEGKLVDSLESISEPLNPEIMSSEGNVVGFEASIVEPFFPDEKAPAGSDDTSAVKKAVSMSSMYLPRSSTPLSPYTRVIIFAFLFRNSLSLSLHGF